MKKNIAQNNSVNLIAYSFRDFIIKPKQNTSKNLSITFKLSENRRNTKFHILPSFLLVRTYNSIYKNYSFEAWKLLVLCSQVKILTLKVRKLGKTG